MRDEQRLPLLDSHQFTEYILAASFRQPVWLFFSANWCMPCRLLEPLLYQLTEETPALQAYKCDVDADEALAMQFQVQSLPVVKCFRHGQLVDSFPGILPLGKLRTLRDQQFLYGEGTS